MTRKYKLQRIHKNIMLGVSGIALASTIALSGAQTTTAIQGGSVNEQAVSQISEIKKSAKIAKNLCKKNALLERKKAKNEADRKFNDLLKALKEKRSADLLQIKNSTGTATTTKEMNKERQQKRLAVEKKYKEDLKALKEQRKIERENADKTYENRVCTATSTPTN